MGDPDQNQAGRASSGDREALTALYHRHKGTLLGFLTRTLGDKTQAEDVFQEGWMKVITGIGRFDGRRGTFKAWLFRVSANTAVDRIRREGVRRVRQADSSGLEGLSLLRQADRRVTGPVDGFRTQVYDSVL